MKTNIKKDKNCKNIVEVTVSPDRVKNEFDKVYEELRKVANVDGYRVGKAPRDLVELHYSKTAKEEVIKRLVQVTYGDVLEEHKLDPIGYPDISDVNLGLDGGFSYKAIIETRPKITLKNYKALKLKKKALEAKEEDVEKNLEILREQGAKNIPKKDSEEKELVLPKLDDEFAKDLGFESLDKLKEIIRENLLKRQDSEIQQDLEVQVINQLVESVDFEIPASLLDAEKKRLIKDAHMRFAYIEAMQKKIGDDKKFTITDKDKLELEKDAEAQAIRQVKAFFMMDEIAQAEKIYLKEEEIEASIEAMAKQYNKSKEEIKKYLEDNHMLDEMAVNMRNKKVIEFLIKEANIV